MRWKSESQLLFLFGLFFWTKFYAQNEGAWSLKLSSSVELRTIKVTNTFVSEDKPLSGATIALYQGNKLVNQTSSDSRGDFSIDIPANGDYNLVVSYQDCIPKKFQISTGGVPEDRNKNNFKPTLTIDGVIMAKPLYSIDYSALKQPMTMISYSPSKKKFSDDENYTAQTLTMLQKIKQQEKDLIDSYLNTIKEGDVALAKNDCPTAKTKYQKASTILPDQPHAKEKLAQADKCVAEAEAAAKAKAAEEAKKKAEEEAKKKAEEEAARLAAEKAAKEKAEAEAAAKAKAKAEEEARLAAEKKAKEEKTSAIVPKDSDDDGPSNNPKGNSKYKVAQTLGWETKYKENIKRADDYFKMKRYAEAKPVYEEALKLKPEDPYATKKIEEIEKILNPQ